MAIFYHACFVMFPYKISTLHLFHSHLDMVVLSDEKPRAEREAKCTICRVSCGRRQPSGQRL